MKKRTGFSGRARRYFGFGELTEVTVLYGNRRAVVRGCRKILSYSPVEIRLALGKRTVCIAGKDLCCVSFAAGCATVEGTLTSLSLQEIARKGEEK